MKFPLLSIDGAKSDSIEISDKLVKLKVNHKLIKFVIDWQLNHAKPRTAKTKQRNEIRGSTKKIVPQKVVVEPDTLVKKLHYLLAVALLTALKVQLTKLKRLIKSKKVSTCTNLIKKKFRQKFTHSC